MMIYRPLTWKKKVSSVNCFGYLHKFIATSQIMPFAIFASAPNIFDWNNKTNKQKINYGELKRLPDFFTP